MLNKSPNLKVNSVANFAGQIYAIFIGILILPLYLKYLGQEAFGLIGFFTMISTWMMMLDAGLSQTISRESARLRNSIEELIEFKLALRSIESIFFTIALLISLLIFFYSEEIAQNWLQVESLSLVDVSYCIALMGFMFGCKWLISLYKGALNGFEHQLWVNGFWITTNTLKFVGGFLLIKYLSQNITIYFSYQFFIFCIELLIINRKLYSLIPKNKKMLRPSILTLKKLAPFAFSIAFTSGMWILVSQVDKMLLSNVLTLKEYGFFSLVVVLSGGLMMLSAPIGTAIRPRLTLLISQNKTNQMIALYRKATQFVAVLGFSIVAIICMYPEEIIFMWTGSMEASIWAGSVLFWYSLGNGVLLIMAFQYYIQFAYGNLKYHVRGNIYFGFVQIACMAYAAYNYGAIGAGKTWFLLQSLFFLFWPGFIHSKFAPGLHLKWISIDVIRPLISTLFSIALIGLLDFNTNTFSRIELLIFFVFSWMFILGINIITSNHTRKFTINLIYAFKK